MSHSDVSKRYNPASSHSSNIGRTQVYRAVPLTGIRLGASLEGRIQLDPPSLPPESS